MLSTLVYKVKTYGVKRAVIYALLELDYLLRKVLHGSYSQRAEDLFLARQFPKGYKGFYIDVGANNPFRFSNTAFFYNKGWQGINVEPDVKNFQEFVRHRTRDINLNIGIDTEYGMLSYYRFNPHTLNTFSPDEAESYVSQGYALLEVVKVPVNRLDTVIESELPKEVTIDFISVDTEGFDINVLKSASLNKYNPKFICVEAVKHTMSGGEETNDLHGLLSENGYDEIYNNGLNAIYRKL